MTVDTRPTTTPSLLHRFGAWLAAHSRPVLIVSALVLVAAAAIGSQAFGKLESGGFDDPGSDSAHAGTIIGQHFSPSPNTVVIVTADEGAITSPAAQQAGAVLTKALAAEPHVTVAGSWFTTPVPALAGKDGRSGMILLVLRGDQSTAVNRAVRMADTFGGDRGAVTAQFGGALGVFGDINSHVSSSLAIAEAIAVPVTMILLLLVFGSLISALLPLLIGGFSIAGTFALLAILGSVTDVSVFAINLTTALGLGLGIDYGLLIVARFREQLALGQDVPAAVARTVATAGRTIAFSAAAVIAALATLTLFPLYFLSSFGFAGIGVVVVAAAAAVIVTPAALALLGHRVEKGKLPFGGLARGSASPFWGRIAAAVYRRPLLTAAPVLAVLLLAASPLLGIHFALPDQTVLPTDAPSRQVATIIDQQYPSRSTATLSVISAGPADAASAQIQARAMAAVPGVTSVAFSGGTATARGVGPVDPGDASSGTLTAGGFQRLLVHTSAPGGSEQARDVVKAVRAAAPPGYLVGGGDASLVDTLAAIGRPLPYALAIIVLTTFVLLFLFTGSVVQPLRALLVNALSLSASVGLVTWIFQDGHLLSVFGATARPMDASMTVLLLSITFGLSMDYEVFLASRITELHEGGADLRTAVTDGLARTGRIVTSAALLLSVSFIAFTTSSVSMLQLFGLGAGVAVLVDATLVRGVLVPAVMRLLGRANFWAPSPLARLHQRVAVRD